MICLALLLSYNKSISSTLFLRQKMTKMKKVNIYSFYAPFFDARTGEERKRVMKKGKKTDGQCRHFKINGVRGYEMYAKDKKMKETVDWVKLHSSWIELLRLNRDNPYHQ